MRLDKKKLGKVVKQVSRRVDVLRTVVWVWSAT